MEKRITLECRGRAPDQIVELILDNCRSTKIEGLTDKFSNLQVLSLINVGLTSLKGFPKLINLKKLELSDNRISGGLELLKGSLKLTHLNLSGNRISTISDLEALKDFPNLRNLDLFNNDVTKVVNYSEIVFNLIESLKYLDGCDRNGVEADSDIEDGDDGDDDDDDEDEDDEEDEEGAILNNKGEDDGLDDDDEDDDDDDEDEDDDSDDGIIPTNNVANNISLSYLQKENLADESDGGEFEPNGDQDSDEEDDDEDDEESATAEAQKGQKRKRDPDDDGNQGDD